MMSTLHWHYQTGRRESNELQPVNHSVSCLVTTMGSWFHIEWMER